MRKFLIVLTLSLAAASPALTQDQDPFAIAEASGVCDPVGLAEARFLADGTVAVTCNPGADVPSDRSGNLGLGGGDGTGTTSTTGTN